MTRAGFIGLGSQGAGMAQRIIEQGLPTTLWARRERSLEPFAGTAALAGDPVAGLHLRDRGEVTGQVVRDRARRLGDPHEGKHPKAHRVGVHGRHVAPDDPARLQLLDPLVRRRAAHADRRADLRVGKPAVALERFQDPGVGDVQLRFEGHFAPLR